MPCPSDAAAVPMLLLQLLQATSTIVFSYFCTTLWLLLLLRRETQMGCYEHQEQLMMPHLLLVYFGDRSEYSNGPQLNAWW